MKDLLKCLVDFVKMYSTGDVDFAVGENLLTVIEEVTVATAMGREVRTNGAWGDSMCVLSSLLHAHLVKKVEELKNQEETERLYYDLRAPFEE